MNPRATAVEPTPPSSDLTLEIRLSPLSVAALKPDGSHQWRIVGAGQRRPGHPWAAFRAVGSRTSSTGRVLSLEDADGRPATLEIDEHDSGFDVRLRSDAPEGSWTSLDLHAASDEHYVGFGERFDSVDQRGAQIDLRVVNGAVRDLAYKPVPFFMSTSGYGARILSELRSLVRVAVADDPEVVSVRTRGPRLDLRLYQGSDLKEILSRYTGDVGRPAVPPSWVFGPWKSRDWTVENQTTVLEDVRTGRDHRLAGTVKLIDATWESETHDFVFDPSKYPDVEAMIGEVRALGYELVLWVAPFMVKGREPGPAYREAEKNGYLIEHPDGGTYVHRLGNSPTFLGSCIDFTNPAAVHWWQGHVRRLVRLGVSGFKTDFGEQVPDDAVFADGRRGYEVRNVFPYLYNRVTYDAMQEETDGVLLARSAWDGSQALSAVWAGDQTADFGPASGLPSVITAGQTAGLSGFPYWASDIGGYFGTPSDEVFTRWAQFGAFSPIMQVHGMGKREPWEFDAETLAIYRIYAQVHLDLFPYLEACAHEASSTGVPMMRALALEFPNDPGVWGDLPEHEYCLGPDLLVAPVYHGYDHHRYTYLPGGAWRDFWTGAPANGGSTGVVDSSIDTIPVFARAGAIVPMLDPSPDTLLPTDRDGFLTAGDDLRLQLYPGDDGRSDLPDGTAFAWSDAEGDLTIANGPRPRWVSATRLGSEPCPVTVRDEAGDSLPYESSSLQGAAGYVRVWLDAGRRCHVVWDSPGEGDATSGE